MNTIINDNAANTSTSTRISSANLEMQDKFDNGDSSNVKKDLSSSMINGLLQDELFEPFVWRNDTEPSCDEKQSFLTITHAASPTSKVDVTNNDGSTRLENWVIGGHFGSLNSTLVFRSSALANPSDSAVQSKPAYKLHLTYKVSQAETKLLSKLLDCHGMTEVTNISTDYNLLWTGSHPKPGTLRALNMHQRVNHFPRSYELTRKDRLYKNIERMQHSKGVKHFDFIPQTFVMPAEFRELCSTHYRIKGPWIVKPVASSRGRGIFIVENPNQVPLDEPVVVAKYLNKPLLVHGHKCDLRLYVLVTCFDPLLVYIYEEGLVRFATVKYDSSHKQLWNPCMHLCNYSINKYHSDYIKSDDPSDENVGHKWTLSALLRHLKSQGQDTGCLMAQIEDIVVKAILASANSIVPACQMFVPCFNNCFELYGFDILIDEHLKPWLLEVNLSPSLCCDSPLDVRLKSAMLADLLTLIGIPAVDPIVKASVNNVTSSNSSMRSMLRMRFSNCRRVHSADGLNNSTAFTSSKKASVITTHNRYSQSALSLTADEIKLVRMAKSQFGRRGGFIRIFPTMDSWAKYSQYLDSVTGIPTCGAPSSSYNLTMPHNYNQMLFTQLFPDIPITNNNVKLSEKSSSVDRKFGAEKKDLSLELAGKVPGLPKTRQDRYERMLSQGHRAALLPKKAFCKESRAVELKQQIMESMKNGKKLTQAEARKTFSQYLSCVLKRIAASPEQEGHVEIVLKFLQKASNYLRTPFSVKIPSHKLLGKDRAAIAATQLNDFLCLYNRETEMYSSTLGRPSQLPNKLFYDFLEHAREGDLEEVLMLQSVHELPTKNRSNFQGILKCLPRAELPARSGRQSVRISRLS